ncbi:hypothetical protein LCGC14_0349560 [marine sediment metagenome]|uniref:Uncharacterized protein n=1 Tax=marine sediment metagenome TaxID=412755 RepID=A0A0F9TGP4_9ZZZZ
MKAKFFSSLLFLILGIGVWVWFMATLIVLGNSGVELPPILNFGFAFLIIYLMYSVGYFIVCLIKWVIKDDEDA